MYVRKLRVLALVFVVGVVALPGVAYAKHSATATGRANLHPLPLSQDEDNGVVPGSLSGVRGTFRFVDDGSSITISGEASGLDPAVTYVSVIADIGSVPGGYIGFGGQGATKGACESLGEDLEGKALVGEWVVDADGHGTITGNNLFNGELYRNGVPLPAGTYVSLEEFNTVSIQQVDPDFDAVACGRVATHPAP